MSDLRYLRRSLSRSPGPALAVWACTAIWIAVAPAILSLLGALDWRSLPLPDAGRIVRLNAGLDLAPALAASGRFQAVATYETGWLVAEGPRGRATAVGARVQPPFFAVLGTRASAGRVFSPGREAMEAGAVVITEGLSRHLFGAPRPPAGAVVRVAGRAAAVLGVVADHPVYPATAQLWVLDTSGLRPEGSFLPAGLTRMGILARLAPGESVPAADATIRALAREYERREKVMQGDVEAVTLAAALRRNSGSERGILSASLAGLLAFVLLAYTSVLAGFLVERQGEMAVRLALGARRRDLVRLLVLEIALLAMPGFLTGLPLAAFALGKLAAFVPSSLAELVPPRLDPASLGLALAGWLLVSAVSLAGVWAAAPRIGLGTVLGGERSEGRAVRPRARARLALVCVALALAVALGAGAAVLQRSLSNLERVPLGFEPRGLSAAVVRFAKAPEPARVPALLDRLGDRLGRAPGVTAAVFAEAIPVGAPAGSIEIASEDRSELWLSQVQGVGAGYLRTTGLRLLAGRDLAPQELATGAPVALVDAEGARTLFGSSSPLGRTVIVADRPVEVVGVVATGHGTEPADAQRPQLYLPLRARLHGEHGPEALALLLRAAGEQPLDAEALDAALAGTGASLAQLRPMPEVVAASLAPRRLARNLVALQWAAALALVALATFGTFSWLLEMRSRELALRLALGDSRAGIARRVLGSALAVTAAAAVLGLAFYLPAGQALRALLFGVEVLSPEALASAVAAVAAAALGAAGLATWAALRRLSFDLLKGQGGAA